MYVHRDGESNRDRENTCLVSAGLRVDLRETIQARTHTKSERKAFITCRSDEGGAAAEK